MSLKHPVVDDPKVLRALVRSYTIQAHDQFEILMKEMDRITRVANGDEGAALVMRKQSLVAKNANGDREMYQQMAALYNVALGSLHTSVNRVS